MRTGALDMQGPETDHMPMRSIHVFFVSLLVSLILWSVLSWPLPRYVFQGIPSSSQNVEKDQVRVLIPGDHLQLLYHFWLLKDMLGGRTRPFFDLYEFSTGNDSERYDPGAYYVPFSLVYAFGASLGGQAFGWNLAQFVSLWLSYFFTWLLVRRYSAQNGVAAVASLVAVVLPYRWGPLLGGSPTGYAMMWLPIIFLGLDLAVRNGRLAGGMLAGAALLLASWSDKHTFLFGALAVPFWSTVALVYSDRCPRIGRAECFRMGARLLPVALLAAAGYLLIKFWSNVQPAGSTIARIPSLREISLFSPTWRDFFAVGRNAGPFQVYLGYTIPAVVAAGFAVMLLRLRTKQAGAWRAIAAFLALCAGIALILLLALGPNGPHAGAWFKAARRLIGPYAMVRQPAKIFCLVPFLLACAVSMGLNALCSAAASGKRRVACLAVIGAIVVAECSHKIHPTVCLLEKNQPAYQAVAADAAQRNWKSHVLVLPLWPGDSHWASIYQYYVSLYRIRMLNGYSPVVSRDYVDHVFRAFESGNKGYLSDSQLDGLQRMGIHYVVLHEDAFPEKVSPFSVNLTLLGLLHHPRLELLRQSGAIWGFRILPAAAPAVTSPPNWRFFSPARQWELERCSQTNSAIIEDQTASRGQYLGLNGPAAAVVVPPVRARGTPEMGWIARVRGNGTLAADILAGGAEGASTNLIHAADWTWIRIPATGLDAYGEISLTLRCVEGAVDADMATLLATEWSPPAAGQQTSFPAPGFFHSGYTDLASDSVVLTPHHEAATEIFYGPGVPMEKGRYRVDFEFSSPASSGVPLGNAIIRSGTEMLAVAPVIAGRACAFGFVQGENLPVTLSFAYSGEAEVRIRRVLFARQE